MQQLFQGKYKIIEQIQSRRTKYLAFVVQEIRQKLEQQSVPKKFIAKVQQLYSQISDEKGRNESFKIPREGLALEQEIQILLDIERNIDKVGFPKAYDVYTLKRRRVLITDLRSMKLTLISQQLLKHLSTTQYTKFCVKVAYDLFDRIQSIHRAHYVHQYLRPEYVNFKKNTQNKDVLFISDYTKAKKFNEYNIKEKTYHRPYQYAIKHRGNNGYASIWNHAKITKSRRDDLDSFCYVCIWLFRGGRLPWYDVNFGSNEEQDKKIFQAKLNLINSQIFESQMQRQQSAFRSIMNFVQGLSIKSQAKQKKCLKVPQQFRQILIEVRRLGFEQQPNYNYMRKQIKKVMNRYQVTETQDYLFPIDNKELYPKGF